MARTISSIITESKGQLLLTILFGSEQQFAISGCSRLPAPAVVLIGPIGVLPEPPPQGRSPQDTVLSSTRLMLIGLPVNSVQHQQMF